MFIEERKRAECMAMSYFLKNTHVKVIVQLNWKLQCWINKIIERFINFVIIAKQGAYRWNLFAVF